VLWLEQVEREALVDRQAQQATAYAQGWEDYAPISVAGRQAAFDEWLNGDPADSLQGRTDAQVRKLMGVA
jgi:hypothetical protein